MFQPAVLSAFCRRAGFSWAFGASTPIVKPMDFLEAHKEPLEKAVYFKMADLMNADVDLLFYDTTSLHFEVDEEDALVMRG